MKALFVALGLTSVLVSISAMAQDAGHMTLKDFRQRGETQQAYMVLGAIALTSRLEIACPQAISIAEWRAALVYRPLSESKPWVEALMELMDERGCGQMEKKADT